MSKIEPIDKRTNSHPIGIALLFDTKYLPNHAYIDIWDHENCEVVNIPIADSEIHKIITLYKVDLSKVRRSFEKARRLADASQPIVKIYCDRKGNGEVYYTYGIDE